MASTQARQLIDIDDHPFESDGELNVVGHRAPMSASFPMTAIG
ncbi:hypothetical protein ACFY3B_04815 [Micromonospora parva]|uniref:Uncharacterized protein n=1 Tax=Micromonospora parva TaxID=1464048 RepID=A0ABW6VQU0_9ACTN